MSEKSVYVIGFPSSGKTTYLAALWHSLNSATDNLSLNLNRLDGNRSYLNLISERWRECLPVDRTPTATRENIQLSLKSNCDDQVLTLKIPDLSGETFVNAISTRSLQPEDETAMVNCTGFLVFISADRALTGVHLDALGEEFSEPANSGENKKNVSWSVENAQEQVRLVDFLQICKSIQPNNEGLRIAIIVSAWDLIPDQNISPVDWLAREHPLLGQYLRNGKNTVNVDVFGISAQGAPFDDKLPEEFMEKDPSDRIVVVQGVKKSKDLSQPLSWLLE